MALAGPAMSVLLWLMLEGGRPASATERPKAEAALPWIGLFRGVWLLPFAGMILNRFGLPIVPLVVLGFGGIALARAASPR